MAKLKRHYVTIKRPATGAGGIGQKSGNDATLLSDVPCSIETLAGNELVIAKQVKADASHRAILWADAATPLTTKDYLVLADGRRLNIGHIDDEDQKGLRLVLLCSEAR